MQDVRVRRLVSGGQTGVDQAALDAALWLGLEHGGWCPKGRRCEDGIIPARYQLQESHSSNYAVRTEQNVADADGTLILYEGQLSGGTAYTQRMAIKYGKPHLLVDLTSHVGTEDVQAWLGQEGLEILNVAGPRESTSRGIAERARAFLVAVLADR